jgi:H+/Cl- antiporter ClcA
VAAARMFLPGDGGASPIAGLHTAPTPARYGPGVALAAIATLASGAVLGPEAPLIALGSVVGMIAAGVVALDDRSAAVASTAGSFSAVSAIFGGPIVAGMLFLEGGLVMGAALLPVLLPGVVAAAVGYTLFVGLGSWGGLDAVALNVPGLPPYDGTSVLDMLVGLGVGIVAALIVAAVRRVARRIDGFRPRLGVPWLLLAGGAMVGVLALTARALDADSQDVLFSGQAAVPALVAEDSISIVLVLLVTKALAYAVSLGSGFRGGPVFPAVFLGVALAWLAGLAFDLSPTLAVAVGTAAGTAAITRLLFMPLLLAALLVGTNGLDAIPAAVFASGAAWLVTIAIDRRAASAAPETSPDV